MNDNVVVVCTGMAFTMNRLNLTDWSPTHGGPFYHKLRDYWVHIIFNTEFGVTL